MLFMSIDGACRRNGKPDCIAAGGIFICDVELLEVKCSYTLDAHERHSTSQRGELLALLTALKEIQFRKEETYIVTDSEYLFNTINKEWFVSWKNNNWRASSGEPVKNADLWKEIVAIYTKILEDDIDLTMFHIKGHCIPFGKVTASKLLEKDSSGYSLYTELCKKYDVVSKSTRVDKLNEAQALSEKNNQFSLDERTLKLFVCLNMMADAIATECVERTDSSLE